MYTADETDRRASKPSEETGKAKGRFALLNTFVDFSMGELSRADIIVWMILYRDSKECVARTAQADIARRGKIDRRTVGRSLRRLAARGLAKIVHQGGFRRGVSLYRVRGLIADPRGT
jgi:DNA-binding MarR family transcriptional regulator